MTKFEANIAETQRELGVSAREALLLEFCAMASWAHLACNTKAEAVAYIGSAHARGDLSAADMRQCFSVLDQA